MKFTIKKAKVIKSEKIKQKKFGAITVKEIFNTPDLESISMALINLDGVNRETVNKTCNNFYFILEGNGEFIIEGKKHRVSKGDLVVIPKNIVYQDKGKLKMIAFSNPRFTSSKLKNLRK